MTSIEGTQWTPNKPDTPEGKDKDGKGKEKKDDDKAANGRWVRPPLARPESLFGLNQRRPPEFLPKPPLPLEKIGDKAEDEEEDEGKEQKESQAQAVETSGQRQDESAEEPFESAVPSEVPEHVDLQEIPLKEEPTRSAETFEEIMAREMPPEFAKATSDEELADPSRADKTEASFEEVLKREMPPPFVRATSGEWLTSPDKDETPPEPKSSGFAPRFGVPSSATRPAAEMYDPSDGPSEASSPREVVSSGGGGAAVAVEALRAVTNLAELANNPYPMVTRAIMEIAVSGFLNGRKLQRYGSLEQQLRQREEQFSEFRQQQRMANEQQVRLQNETLQHMQEQQIFDQEGNRIVLQPGWRIERSAGGYSTVLDQHNRVIYDAIHYGESFKRDQKREQLSDDVFAAIDAGVSIGTPISTTNGGQGSALPGQSTAYGVGNDTEYEPTVDLKHRLPKPKESMAASIFGSPWLWTAIALIIIVYFLAALA